MGDDVRISFTVDAALIRAGGAGESGEIQLGLWQPDETKDENDRSAQDRIVHRCIWVSHCSCARADAPYRSPYLCHLGISQDTRPGAASASDQTMNAQRPSGEPGKRASECPRLFEFDVLLEDGRAIHLRPIRRDDADREHAFFQRVGPESAYFRFFSPKPDLSPKELRYFTTVDYDARMAFIALHGDDMIAVGRYDVLPDESDEEHKVAEIALLVEDDFQGVGIGSLLLQHLTEYARFKGITRLAAFVLAGNSHMLRLLRKSGYTLTSGSGGGMYRFELPLEP